MSDQNMQEPPEGFGADKLSERLKTQMAGHSLARPPGSVREVAVIMGALLRKHGVIDAAAIDDPEGYDNYDTLGRLLRVAKDWCEWYSPNAADQRRRHMSDSNSRKTRGRRSTASAGSPHRGTRCGVCYWALYDGDWCQNPKCVMSGKSVGENRIYLTNDEAQTLIAANIQAHL